MREKIKRIWDKFNTDIAPFVALIILGILAIAPSIALLNKTTQLENQDEYIKQLEQSLSEQIQEVEVYRGILETYQIEGIINE